MVRQTSPWQREQINGREMFLWCSISPWENPPARGDQISCLRPLASCKCCRSSCQKMQHHFSSSHKCSLFCPTSPRADTSPIKTSVLPCFYLIPQLFPLPRSLLPVSAHLDGLSHTFKCSGSLDMKFNKLRMTCTIPAVLPSPINSPLLPFLSYCFTYYSMPNKLSVMLQHQTFIILCIRWLMSELTSNFCPYNSRILILHEKNIRWPW